MSQLCLGRSRETQSTESEEPLQLVDCALLQSLAGRQGFEPHNVVQSALNGSRPVPLLSVLFQFWTLPLQ